MQSTGIKFGAVPTTQQLEVVRRAVGPELADRVTAENTDFMSLRQSFDQSVSPVSGKKELPGYRRIENTFVDQVQSGAVPEDHWFDMFAVIRFPSKLLAKAFKAIALRGDMGSEKARTRAIVQGRDIVFHKRESVEYVRSFNKLG